MKKTKTTTREAQLPCRLTDAELMDRAIHLAELVQDIDAEEKRQADVKSELKARLQSLLSQQAAIANVVARREEIRAVQVERIYQYADKSVVDVRRDTGEVLSTRRMTEDEAQGELDLNDDESVVDR